MRPVITASPTRDRASRRFPGSSPTAELDQPTREGLVAAVIAVGAALVLLMWWADTTPASVQGTGPWLTAAGRVTGLLGTYLVVVGVLLMGRVSWLDRLIGMDRLAVWHRRNGEYSLTLLVAHAVLIIWGYAVTAHESLFRETSSVVLSYTDMLAATVGLGLMVVIGVISARAIRRRISYQAWYFIHLYAYLALALSFAHQFATGADFTTHPLNRAAWIALYAGVGGLLVAYRVVKPVRDGFRHRLRVAGIARESAESVSVYLTGRDLHLLAAESGQFFMWRFLTRDGWWQAHPYSLSAAPNGEWLRVTVKGLGDHSRDLPRRAPRHPGARRRPLRRLHVAPPPPAPGPAHWRRRRYHPVAGVVRVAAGARPGHYFAVPGSDRRGSHVPQPSSTASPRPATPAWCTWSGHEPSTPST